MLRYRTHVFSFMLFLFIGNNVYSGTVFQNHFHPKTLRIDYIQVGGARNAEIIIDKLIEEPHWGGPVNNLTDPFRYGHYMAEVYDQETMQLIYSRGYSTLFNEWQTTGEADTVHRAFNETLIIPFPKHKIMVRILKRDRKNIFHLLHEFPVDPSDPYIKKEPLINYDTINIHFSGSASNHVDIVILPEGYRAHEMEKFINDAKRFSKYFLSWKPFNETRDKFNIRAVLVSSVDSSADIPEENIWVNTAFNSTFYTFKSERYLTTGDIKTLRDVAATVPYDQICVLVNSSRYGGGGIYNFFSFCTSDNEYSEYVFCHEFGHSFGSLADEYYTSSTSYNDFYDLSVEPFEPNITTLVDFDRKWKHMLQPGIPVPTPETEAYTQTTGVFEGAGYVTKGMYRGTYDSSMKSRSVDNFGEVNCAALIQMIRFISDEKIPE